MKPARRSTFLGNRLRFNLVWQARCGMISAVTSFFFWRNIETPGLLSAQWISFALSAVTVLFLQLARPTIDFKRATLLYFFTILHMLPASWIANAEYSTLIFPWVPFQMLKIGLLVQALFAPPRAWVGVAGILLVLASALARFLSVSPHARLLFAAIGEPWSTCFVSMFALVVFFLRMHASRLALRELRARIEAAVARRFLRRILALKDWSNTPLQTLELNSALIRALNPERAKYIDRIDHSIARLKSINDLVQKESGAFRRLRLGTERAGRRPVSRRAA